MILVFIWLLRNNKPGSRRIIRKLCERSNVFQHRQLLNLKAVSGAQMAIRQLRRKACHFSSNMLILDQFWKIYFLSHLMLGNQSVKCSI